MGTLILHRVGDLSDSGVKPNHAVARVFTSDYTTGAGSILFDGWSSAGYVAAYIRPDGSGLILSSRNPDVYVEYSAEMAKKMAGFEFDHDQKRFGDAGVPSEYEVDEGHFDPNAATIELKTKQTWY